MATVDKNFKVKHGLVVEGNTATVNGEDILTTGSTISTTDLTEGTNLFFTEQRAVDAVTDEIANAVTTAVDALTTDAIEEGQTNLYFSNALAVYAVEAEATPDSTPNTLVKRNGQGGISLGVLQIGDYGSPVGSINANEGLTILSASGGEINILASADVTVTSSDSDIVLSAAGNVYVGSAASGNEIATTSWVNTQGFLFSNALTGYATETYVNNNFLYSNALTGYATEGYVNSQGFITNADLTGLATETYVNSQGFLVANDITGKQDTLTPAAGIQIGGSTGSVISTRVDNSTIRNDGGSGEDTLFVNYGSGLTTNTTGLIVDTDVIATKSYTDNAITTAVDGLVDGAPGLLDTLNELAAAINDDDNYATTMTTALAGKQATLNAGYAISSADLANNIVSVNYGNTLTRDGGALVVDTTVIATKNYVDTEVGTKQDALTAGNGIDITANTISANVDGLSLTVYGGSGNQIALNAGPGLAVGSLGVSVNVDNDTLTSSAGTTGSGVAVRYGDGLTTNSTGLIVDTTAIASKSYVDTNFVNAADLPGQLDDYVLLSEKGSFDGVATLDGTGNVPVEQLGNVPAAYVTSVGNNLSVTGGELNVDAIPAFTAVEINSIARQVAATATASETVTVISFLKADYRAAKFLVKVDDSTNTEVTEVLLTLDSSNNIAITEYAIVGTNGALGSITAEVDGPVVALVVTPVGLSTINVVGTLLA